MTERLRTERATQTRIVDLFTKTYPVPEPILTHEETGLWVSFPFSKKYRLTAAGHALLHSLKTKGEQP